MKKSCPACRAFFRLEFVIEAKAERFFLTAFTTFAMRVFVPPMAYMIEG
jgi:hypothetical protein